VVPTLNIRIECPISPVDKVLATRPTIVRTVRAPGARWGAHTHARLALTRSRSGSEADLGGVGVEPLLSFPGWPGHRQTEAQGRP
jgi:hypothetical protein